MGTNHIRKLSFFGSASTGRFHTESDVEVLVEFEIGHMPGLLAVVRMERQLGEILNRRVDLRPTGDLSRYFRDEVVSSATPRYERP